MSTDLLVVAGTASETLERHGFIACGRRENGVTRVDFWRRDGRGYRYELNDPEATTEDVVTACLSLAGLVVGPEVSRRISHLS